MGVGITFLLVRESAVVGWVKFLKSCLPRVVDFATKALQQVNRR